MNISISSESNDDVILSNNMTNDQYSDMIDNLQVLDEYYNIAIELYKNIYPDIAACPNTLFNKLTEDSFSKFYEFIVENCIGVKYIDHVNKIYNFKDKYCELK